MKNKPLVSFVMSTVVGRLVFLLPVKFLGFIQDRIAVSGPDLYLSLRDAIHTDFDGEQVINH